MNYFIDGLKKYALFTGRTVRREFWMYMLFYFAIDIVLSIIGAVIHLPFLVNIYQLALALPTIGMWIRRMHDIDRVGWWCLIPFYNLYLGTMDGTPGENRFGPDPKARPPVQGFEVVTQ